MNKRGHRNNSAVSSLNVVESIGTILSIEGGNRSPSKSKAKEKRETYGP